jgi:hypothetical protein
VNRMDEWTARDIDEVIKVADAAARDFENFQARRARERFVVKTVEPKPEHQQVTMSPEVSARWAEWAAEIARSEIEADWANIHSDAVGQAMAEYVGGRLQSLIERVEAVELVNIGLRAEIDTLRNKAAADDNADVVLNFRKRTGTNE